LKSSFKTVVKPDKNAFLIISASIFAAMQKACWVLIGRSWLGLPVFSSYKFVFHEA